jgi:DNA-binding beta-propeller fold protein YncE
MLGLELSKKLFVTLIAAAFVSTILVSRAVPASTVARDCPAGAIPANMGGGQIECLQIGGPCLAKFADDYPGQGFLCVQGRLAKVPKPVQLRFPPASALPADAVKIQLPSAGDRSLDVGQLASTPSAIWVPGGVFRIGAGGQVAGPFDSGASQDIGAGDGAVWASDYASNLVRRYDAATGRLVATIHLPLNANPEGIAITPGAVWVAEHHSGLVARIDPQTNRVVARVHVGLVGSSGPQGIAFGLGAVWVGIPNTGEVVRIDPATNKVVARIAVPSTMSPCGGIGVARNAVWVTGCSDGHYVARIDPSTNAVSSILDVGGFAWGITGVGENAWFVVSGNADYSRNQEAYLIELRPNDTVARRIALGPGFISGGTLAALGSIWVGDWIKPLVIKIPHLG